MAKRTIESGSDDDGPPSASSSPKRTRRRSPSSSRASSPEQQQQTKQNNGNANGVNGSRVNGGGGGSDSESDSDSGDFNDEEVRQNRLIIDRLRGQQMQNGSVAQSGVIEQVDLENFMCHKLTTVKFGPQINFLVGNNGSGKSAVLTGITMALGGNAKATNRATKGSGFVREGAPSAKCSVRIRNRGPDAYLPHVYGDSITIERRFSSEGGGGYKILNNELKLVDTRKLTLDAILDHLNIQVDNPLTVLTQDQSRQFLASATSKDKYNFFLRGSQLAALTEEYESIRENTEVMEAALEQKKGVMPELREAYRVAKQRAGEAQAAVGQQDKLTQLKHELAWAFVAETEDDMEKGRNLIAKQRRNGEKFQAEVDKHRKDFEGASDYLANLNEAAAGEVNTDAVQVELDQVRAQIKENKEKMSEQNNEVRRTNATVKRMTNSIANYDEQINEAREKQQRDAQTDRQPIIDRLAAIEAEVSQAAREIAKARHSADDADEARRAQSEKLTQAKDAIAQLNEQGDEVRRRLANLQRTENNALLAYGEHGKNIGNAIKAQSAWHKKPVGPIGMFTKLLPQHKNYAAVLESFFSHTLNAYLVEDEHDKQLLNKIFRETVPKNAQPPIIKQARDSTFDFSRGVPPDEVLTIHRALTFDGPDARMIEAVLINSNHIEKAALVAERPLGDALMRRRLDNVESCFSANGFRIGGGDGGSSSQTMNAWRGQRRLSPDLTEQANQFHAEIAEVGERVKAQQRAKQQLDNELTELHNATKAAERRQLELQTSMGKLNSEKLTLSEKLREDEPDNIASIEDAKRDAQQELDLTVAQFTALNEAKEKTNRDAQPLIERKRELEAEIDKQRDTQSKIDAKLNTAVKAQIDFKKGLDLWEKKLTDHNAGIDHLEEQYKTFEERLASHIESASKVCERPVVEKFRSAERLQREVDALKQALRVQERQQGASIEQIMTELANRKAVVEKAKASVQELEALVQVLKTAYTERVSQWMQFRDSISARAREQFTFHLAKRGFGGKLNFNHDRSKLDMRIQTDDAQAGKGKRTKDTKSLSGGEKSFSTICLLLTMWDSLPCPIRCLDEFDVFMDAVNRRISMSMLIETAKTANSTQHILISPQEMGSLNWGPEVRVTKLSDPGRNQGTLALGA